uniref:Uncharacterized protein n=1 Tax=Daucus carota subsp. sativus TaxID=79200 RepID=A0A161XX15_DAUCS
MIEMTANIISKYTEKKGKETSVGVKNESLGEEINSNYDINIWNISTFIPANLHLFLMGNPPGFFL